VSAYEGLGMRDAHDHVRPTSHFDMELRPQPSPTRRSAHLTSPHLTHLAHLTPPHLTHSAASPCSHISPSSAGLRHAAVHVSVHPHTRSCRHTQAGHLPIESRQTSHATPRSFRQHLPILFVSRPLARLLSYAPSLPNLPPSFPPPALPHPPRLSSSPSPSPCPCPPPTLTFPTVIG
jgi:hypothetical protein